MASIERTAYPRFRPSLSERELETLYEPTPRERRLADALRFIQNRRKARRDYVDCEIDLGFLSRRWRAYVEKRPGGGEVLLKRRELEVCVMSHVADGLRSGDLYVPGSEKYADYREQLLLWEE